MEVGWWLRRRRGVARSCKEASIEQEDRRAEVGEGREEFKVY